MKKNNPKKLWSGRFEKNLRKEVEEMEFSEFDNRLIREDIWGTEIHNIMLYKQKIITKKEAKKIFSALRKIKREWQEGKFRLVPELEDVHMGVESKVIEKIGINIGGKIHTGRSRNDQRSLDLRLATREQVLEILDLLINFEEVLLRKAKAHLKDVMPGFTHTQQAEVITIGFWLTSFVEMFLRDMKRLNECYQRINMNPLGGAALAGTSWNIDRNFTTRLLVFDKLVENSLDAVGSRDFLAEFVSDLSILGSNLSRLLEDLLIFSTQNFNYIVISDEFTTGSSIMPHKKNPDFIELSKGKIGKIYGNLIHILTTLKSLPSGYNRDFQELNSTLFESSDEIKQILKVLKGIIVTLKFNKEKIRKSINSFCNSVELANLLVRKGGISFREAHLLVGALVKNLEKDEKILEDLDLEMIKKTSREVLKNEINLDKRTKLKLSPEESVYLKISKGSTNPKEVEIMIKNLGKEIKLIREEINEKKAKIEKAKRKTKEIINEILSN